MEKLYLGIELDDNGCNLSWLNPENESVQELVDSNGQSWIPAFLCLDTETGRWTAGEEAEAANGRRGSVVLKDLLSFFRNGQSLNLNDVCYTADDIMQEFLSLVLQEAVRRSGLNGVEHLVLCLEQVSIADAEKLSRICCRYGIDSMNVHVLNRQECFMYYLMSQEHEKWSNTSFLFDYGAEGLHCYEMTVLKGLKPITVKLKMEKMNGAPLMETTNGNGTEAAATDRWFSSLAEKKMAGKIVSSVVLCGEGFAQLNWAEQFVKSIYSQKSRKVYQVTNIYGMGAAFAAYHMADEHRNFPYCCICTGRISTTVSIFVDGQNGSEQLIMARAGMNYYDARTSLELNLIEQKDLALHLRNTGAPEGYTLHLDMSPFMENGRERTKIRLSIAFLKEDTMVVRVEDLGFGEIYPSTGQIIQQIYEV